MIDKLRGGLELDGDKDMGAKENPSRRASHPRIIAWQLVTTISRGKMVTGVAKGGKNRLCRPAYEKPRLRQCV